MTFVGPVGAGDWKYWRSRGVVTGVGHTWFDLLRSPIDKAVDALVGQDYGGNPQPVMMIDEFGFDYGGLMDQKSAQVLRQTKLKKPDLALAVWDMRGPIPQVLAEAYRDVADLVMLESYVGSQQQYWFIASQVWSARRYGILPKTIVVLGVGKGGNPGENWAETKEELEQQIRFVRLIAPESPGIGFYSGTPELLAAADALCGQFFQLPTDGSGLPAEVRDLAKTFSRRYEKPTLAVSPSFVEPNYNEDGKGIGRAEGDARLPDESRRQGRPKCKSTIAQPTQPGRKRLCRRRGSTHSQAERGNRCPARYGPVARMGGAMDSGS